MELIPEMFHEFGREPVFDGPCRPGPEDFYPTVRLEGREIMFFFVDTDLLHDLEAFSEEFYDVSVERIYLLPVG